MKKILLVFGAGGNLGKGVTVYLLKQDYEKVYLFDYKEILIAENKGKFIQTGDLSIEENVREVFNKIEIDRDAHYFLFSTIGGFAGGKIIAEYDYEEWQKMLNLNLNISFLLAKHFSLICQKSKGGAICFTSALTAFAPAVEKSAYGLSKNALNYLVKTLSKEARKYNLSVNAIAPNILDTEENRKWVKNSSDMVNSKNISKLVYDIFENSRILSGNILELPFTINQ